MNFKIKMSKNIKKITLEDLEKHKGGENPWILIDGKVYDVTNFLTKHPGGKEILIKNSGKDSTKEFMDIKHSEDAKKLLDTYFIGNLELI